MKRTSTAGLVLALAAAAALAIAATSAFGQAQPAPGERPGRLGEMLGLKQRFTHNLPTVAHFIADGVAEFTFDRSTDRPMIQFSDNGEIFALHPQPAPRGDVIYKNDVGDPVLRLSGLGGVTVFTPSRPQGAPAELVGMGDPIALLANIHNATDLFRRMQVASRRIGLVVQHPVSVDAPDLGPETYDLAADVLVLAVDAFERNAPTIRTDPRMRKVTQVLILEGERPGVTLSERTLTIVIASRWGVAGRPSSYRIASALR